LEPNGASEVEYNKWNEAEPLDFHSEDFCRLLPKQVACVDSLFFLLKFSPKTQQHSSNVHYPF